MGDGIIDSGRSIYKSRNNSLDILRTALEKHKELEGDQKTRQDALRKIEILSKDIWRNHVIKEIE